MDQPKWLKLSALGLIIVILGFAFFAVTGRFSSKKYTVLPIKEGSIQVASPSPSPIGLLPSPTPNAYQTLANKTNPKATNLPNTAFPTGLFVIFSSGAALIGFGLKKFPH